MFNLETETSFAAEPPPSPKKQMRRTVAMDASLCASPMKRPNKAMAQRAQEILNENRNRRCESIDDEITVEPSSMPKRALPAGLAESFRAVFAAFLWHEGLVHDAMACATFLKFHPTLPKRNALTFTNDEIRRDICRMSKEQRARQRYSVEVANAGNYLNIRPSTLETLNKSGQSSILNRRNRRFNGDVSSSCSSVYHFGNFIFVFVSNRVKSHRRICRSWTSFKRCQFFVRQRCDA